MNKRGIRLLIIFLAVFAILSFSVYAQGKGLTDIFEKIGKLIFHDFARMGEYGFKFLLWLILFSIFDFGLGKRGAKFDNKIAGTIAFALSLAVVIILPKESVFKIFGLYSRLVVIALGLIVPLILGGVIHEKFKGDGPWDILTRGLGYMVVGWAMVWFATNATLLLEKFAVAV